MPLVVKDRIKETSATSGTGTLTLAGASAGFRSFADVGNGNTTYYAIVDATAGTWEVGIGTYTSLGTTLSRTTILSNSSGTTAAINFAANSKDVFVTYPASKSLYYQDSGGVVISENSSSDALRVTQTGSGNVLVIEDTTNPDSSPIVVDQTGLMVLGDTGNLSANLATGNAKLQIAGGTAPLALYRNADSTTAINLEFAKRRATGGVLNSGDTIGRLYFSGNDGTNAIPAAYIDAAVDGTPGTNDMPGRLVFSTTADGAATPTERMRIDSAGNVGIGSTNLTGRKLVLSGTVTGSTTSYGEYAAVTFQSDVTTHGYGVRSQNSTQATAFTLTNLSHFGASQGTVGAGSTITNQYGFNADSSLIGATNNYGFYSNIPAGTGDWNFYANGTADNYFAGDVGIGTISPAYPLQVSTASETNIAITGGTSSETNIFFGDSGSATIGRITYNNSGDYMRFYVNAAERMRIDSSGNVGIGVTPSGSYKLEVNGDVAGKEVVATNGIFFSNQIVSESVTFPAGYEGISGKNTSIASGITVTVPSGATWTIV